MSPSDSLYSLFYRRYFIYLSSEQINKDTVSVIYLFLVLLSVTCSRFSVWITYIQLLIGFIVFVCSTASNSPRSTPGSSPSLRRRVLGGGKASESEGGGEKSSGGGGGGGSDSPLPSLPSASSLSSAYPLASRHFSRNAKVRLMVGLMMSSVGGPPKPTCSLSCL